MGKKTKTNEHFEYRQENGEITAWFQNTEEKMELTHEGSSLHKKIFYFLISMSFIYLLIVFLFVH